MNLIPEGNYLARARTWTYVKSAKENWYLSVTFEVLASEHAGQQVKGALHFTYEAQCRASYVAMQLMGWPGGDPMDCHDNRGGLDRNEVEVVVRHDQFKGHNYAKVERVVRPGDGAAERDALRQFLNSRMVQSPSAASAVHEGSANRGNV